MVSENANKKVWRCKEERKGKRRKGKEKEKEEKERERRNVEVSRET